MKYLVVLALLPCIFGAEIKNAVCEDGRQCAEGEYCCELSTGEPGCCQISKELKDKGYVPALPPSSISNETVSMAQPKTMNTACFGTQCGVHCIPNLFAGVCCNNQMYACPAGTRCCSNFYSQKPWCCLYYQRCTSNVGLCRNGAIATSTAMISVMFALMIGVVSKYFL